jgi:1-phosphatidylinositol-4-phosphate 5-kinase
MMIGIQMAVKSVNAVEELSVQPRDFSLKYYFELLPRRVGNDKSTMKICKFFDYAP